MSRSCHALWTFSGGPPAPSPPLRDIACDIACDGGRDIACDGGRDIDPAFRRSETMTVTARAAILKEPGQALALEEVDVEEPRANEVLVRLVSVGVCRTDTHAMAEAVPPAVLGHEGAGLVVSVGSRVTKVAAGDKVLMTFTSCGMCRRCRLSEMAYCERFNELNFSGHRPDGSTALSSYGAPVAAHFLGQSCFATHSVVDERSVVRVDPATDLRPLGPFGCGFQTGAGAVLNALRPPAGSSIAIFGAGAVGLAAIAAASIVGCSPIVAVDTVPRRLEMARRFGATVVVDANRADRGDTIGHEVRGGLDYAIDTTGLAAVLEQAVGQLNTRGTCAVIGAGPSPTVSIDWRTLLNGRTITGIIAGNSVPDVFLPDLVNLYHAGRFPVGELIEYFPFDEINRAIEASSSGAVIKPVVVFD